MIKWKHRYSILSIITLTYLVCYVDRVVISATIPYMADEFHLSSLAMGSVMSAFFFSYSLFQFPGGILVDKFGPNLMMTIGLLWWTVFTFLTGLASSLAMLIVIRVLFGIGEAVWPPAATKTVSAWFPENEKGFAYSIYSSTWQFGVALGPLFAGFMIAAWGWRNVFYSLIIPGLIFAPLIWLYVKNSPAQSKGMTAKELQEFETSDAPTSAPGEKVPLGTVLKNSTVWILAFILFFANVGMYGLMSWLPTYLVKGRGFSPVEMAIGSSIPFFLGWFGMIVGGYISDKFFKNNRKLPVVVLFPLGGVFLAFVVGAQTAITCVVLQSISLFIASTGAGAYWALVISALPTNVVGTSYGVIGTIGQAAGFVIPIILGYLINVSGNFNSAFMFLVAAYVATGIIAMFVRREKPETV